MYIILRITCMSFVACNLLQTLVSWGDDEQVGCVKRRMECEAADAWGGILKLSWLVQKGHDQALRQ
jgi:hypothetical protein